ncbi:MAG: hypothetical protein QXL94_00525 [Candidatus Parvarchaeum sp.]
MKDTIVDLPDGNTATMGLSFATERQMRPLRTRLTASVSAFTNNKGQIEPETVNEMFEAYDLVIYTTLKSWTLDLPLPATANAVQDLPIDVYRPLYEAATPFLSYILGAGENFEPGPKATSVPDTGSSSFSSPSLVPANQTLTSDETLENVILSINSDV